MGDVIDFRAPHPRWELGYDWADFHAVLLSKGAASEVAEWVIADLKAREAELPSPMTALAFKVKAGCICGDLLANLQGALEGHISQATDGYLRVILALEIELYEARHKQQFMNF